MSEITTLQRKVTQLDNDVSAIYSMLANLEGMSRRHQTRLDGLDDRLDGIDNRLDGMDNRLGDMDSRLAGIEGHLNGMDNKLNTIEGLLKQLIYK